MGAERVLCCRLYGSAAAWGSPGAAGGERPSDTRPGRGAILGILGAALGLRVEQEEAHRALGASTLTAVASHGRLRLNQEFRTAEINPKPPRGQPAWRSRREAVSSVSKRDLQIGFRGFVEDGLWRVFVAARPGQALDLDELARALAMPVFNLSLGRKEYPLSLPTDPVIIEGGLEDALEAYPPVPTLRPPVEKRAPALAMMLRTLHRQITAADAKGYALSWDLGFPGAPADGQARPVADDPVSRTERRFRTRMEARLFMPPLAPVKANDERKASMAGPVWQSSGAGHADDASLMFDEAADTSIIPGSE